MTKIDLETGLKVWDKNLTNPEPSSVRETTSIGAVAVSTDSKWIAGGGDYGYLALLSGDTGTKSQIFSCDPQMFAPEHFQALAFSADTRTLLSASTIQTYPVNNSGYNKMRFPDRSAELLKHRIVRWDTQTGTLSWSQTFEAGAVLQIGFSHSQDTVLLAATDRVSILSAISGELIREYKLGFYEGDLLGSFISGATFSPDLRLLAISSFSGVTLIDTQSGKMLKRLRANLESELGRPEFFDSGNFLKAFDAYGNIYEWNLVTGDLSRMGRAQDFSLTYNGPSAMPILSLANGKFLIQTASQAGGGMGVTIPRIEPSSGYPLLCKSGPDADLPPLTLKESAVLSLWQQE